MLNGAPVSFPFPSAGLASLAPQHAQHSDVVIITPDELVGMILGYESITLKGFEREQTPLPFWMPSVQTYSHEAMNEAVAKARKPFKTLFLPALLVILLTISIVAYWVGTIEKMTEPASAMIGAWTAKSVSTDGILLNVEGVGVGVPVGGLLPNGEILRHVDTVRQTYATDSQTTAIKKQ
jgi:hypothetical protein